MSLLDYIGGLPATTDIRFPISLPEVVTLQAVSDMEPIRSDYPRRRDVEPGLSQNEEGIFILRLHNQGSHGTFEIPYINNQIVYADSELVAILVSYHGTEAYGPKRDRCVSKGQFWRFYQKDDNGLWARVNWQQLEDASRTIILEAVAESTPAWAKKPGMLKSEHASPKRVKTLAYKLVVVRDGRYFSVYKPDEEYVLGELKQQAAKSGHRAGYYSYPDHERVLRLFHDKRLFPYCSYRETMTLALLECEIGGKIIEYQHGKWASTFLRPLRVLSTLEYSPN